jgi:hypothetical protein
VNRISAKRRAALESAGLPLPFSTITKKGGKPLNKRGAGKAKRQQRNAAYYKSAEWRAKRKAVFERDDYRCVELVDRDPLWAPDGRCPMRGEIVNGKQTARGLVAEESGYQHRGIEGAIDRIKTRCKDCDRRLTPLERINHRYGFQK